jgi:colanic acid/amylovoran biosynthesis glycosyltransferase
MRIAYLVSRFPALSHTFIAREIDGLRARGVDVAIHAIRPAPAHELVSAQDRRHAAETWTVLPPRWGELVQAHAYAAMRHPLRYVTTLALAFRLSAGGLRNALWQLFYFVEAVALWNRLRARRIHHVHAHFANVATGVALLVARLGGRHWSWSFTMHGPTEFDDVTRYGLAEKVRRARFVSCISGYCRSQLMKLVEPDQWPKLEIVRCGVDPSAFVPVERDGRPDSCEVLCVGRLVADKGQHLLIDAADRLCREGVDIHVTLAGDGPDRARLEDRAAALGLGTRMTFAGAVSQDQLRELYARADVFCLPSFAEGLPVVLMEAMASGLPVVTTGIMGIPELVEHEVSGELLPPGSVDALAAALRRLADDPHRRNRYGRAGRAKVEADYDIRASVAAINDLYARYLDTTAWETTRARNGSPSTM